MSFQAPLLLLGLLLVPVAVWLYFASHAGGSGRETFSTPALLPSVAPDRPGWRRHVPVALYGLALTALLVALARPQATLAVGMEQATVVLVTDHSGSMAARDVRPTRLAAAQRAAARFLEEVPDEVRVGAIGFNHVPEGLQSPTRDRDAVRRVVDDLRAEGGTRTGDALALALRMAAQPPRPGAPAPPAAVVLLSDGKSQGRDPVAVADEAARADVPVYTVALGTDRGTVRSKARDGSLRTIRVVPDPATLRRMAEASGGESFSAEGAGELEAVYKRLGSQVATERRRQELTAGFAGGALGLVVAAGALSLRWFGKLP